MPDTTTLNVAALREIVPVLYELERQERFFMEDWAAGLVNPHADSYTECGTQFCMAGAKAVFDGWRPQYRMREVWSQRLGQVVERAVATGRFVRPENRHDESWGRSRTAYDIALKAFGLTDQQANFLFHATHITRVSDMEKRIEFLIARPDEEDPDDIFPESMRAAEREHAAADELAQEKAGRRSEPTLWQWRDEVGEFDDLLGDEPTA